MGIFTTREIAIFIYAILLLVYVLLRKKGKDIVLSIIKAACHIKLVIPFLIVLVFATLFTWLCTYLPFWDWQYVKDIIFWTLFAGVPVCFNATSRKLDDHYFKHIIIDNLKFAALVEFITGTFTFHIIGELILQPLLVFFMILQSSLVKKTETAKKITDSLIGIAGLIIIGLTIKSVIDSIGGIYFIDILVGLILPVILSIVFLPVAYFFALYAKYEILFLRINSKEPDDRKLKIKHRIKIIRLCKFSYKKVCRFLYEYVPKMYVKMSYAEFENIIDEFRGTTEHTYIAVIMHNGSYYVSRNFNEDNFRFNKYTTNKGGLFNSWNKPLRKEIALQIQEKTPFKNTDFNNTYLHYSVSLRKIFLFTKGAFFKRTKIAVFLSNTFEIRNNTVDLPFGEGVKQQSDKNTRRLMWALKWDTYGLSFFAVLMYFVVFLLSSFIYSDSEVKVNLDLAALVFTIISQVQIIFNSRKLTFKIHFGRKLICLQNNFLCIGIWEIFVFIIAYFISYFLQPLNISNSALSKLGIAFLFSGVLIDMWKKEQ